MHPNFRTKKKKIYIYIRLIYKTNLRLNPYLTANLEKSEAAERGDEKRKCNVNKSERFSIPLYIYKYI